MSHISETPTAAPAAHCPACRTDFPTVAGFREHLPACRSNDPSESVRIGGGAMPDRRSRLLADVFLAEARRYEAQDQRTEAWMLRWAADVCLESPDRLVQRITETW